MRIAVAYKWAPNAQDATVAGDGSVDWGRAKASVSEYDQVAIEVGRRLADSTGAELVGITVGGADAASPIARKTALSRGLDRLVVATDESMVGASAGRTSRALAALVQEIGDLDLVLTGDSSQDLGAQLVPGVLAAVLGRPVVTNVTAVTGTPGDLIVHRVQEAGAQTLRVTGPVVLAVAGDAAEPRVPGMKDILAAGKKPTQVVEVPALAPEPVTVVATAPPEMKARKRLVLDGSDPAAAAAELVAALRADQLV